MTKRKLEFSEESIAESLTPEESINTLSNITLLDYASPGVYLTPTNVGSSSADLEVKVLVRNTEASTQSVTVRAKIYDANDLLVDTLQTTQSLSADTTETVVQNTTISNPHLWNGRADPYLYKVLTEVEVGGLVVDTVEQPLGFRYYSVDVNNGFILNCQSLDTRCRWHTSGYCPGF